MLLNPRPVRSDSLTWCGNENVFVGVMSDIGGFGRVWDDACDYGLTLVSSKKPGQEIVFVVVHEESRDGDTLWWDLLPANGDRGIGRRDGWFVRIYND